MIFKRKKCDFARKKLIFEQKKCDFRIGKVHFAQRKVSFSPVTMVFYDGGVMDRMLNVACI